VACTDDRNIIAAPPKPRSTRSSASAPDANGTDGHTIEFTLVDHAIWQLDQASLLIHHDEPG
jgi:hypothetical protein